MVSFQIIDKHVFFSDVLRSVTDLFESRYQGSLRRADRTILEQIDLIQVAVDLFLYTIHRSYNNHVL